MNLQSPFFTIVSGMPMSGKSSCIRYIMCENNIKCTNDPFQFGVVFSNTAFENAFDYIPKKNVYGSYNPQVLQNLMDIQQETGAKYKAFVIFDDCLSTKAFSSQLFVNLTTGYRHWNISIIIIKIIWLYDAQ